jgi:predicted ribosome quality control (RQC) complex YloA/Tae2 family protein
MDNFYLSALLTQIRPLLLNKRLAKVSLADSDLLFDFRLPDNRIVKASFERSSPALYLCTTDQQPQNDAHPFVTTLRNELVGTRLIDIYKAPLDRIVRLVFQAFDESGRALTRALLLWFTGRTANAFLLDANNIVEVSLNTRGSDTLRVGDVFDLAKPELETAPTLKKIIKNEQWLDRVTDSSTQTEIIEQFLKTNTLFTPTHEKEFIERCHEKLPKEAFITLLDDLLTDQPQPLLYSRIPLQEIGQRKIDLKNDLKLSHFPLAIAKELQVLQCTSLSEAAALFYQARGRALRFQIQHTEVTRFIREEIKKLAKRLQAIQSDKEKFENPERFKKLGDLLLANFSTARRQGSKAFVIDYYDPAQTEIEIELGEGKTLQQASQEFFSRSQKAKRALETIAEMESSLHPKLKGLRQLAARLEDDLSTDQLDEIKTKAERLLGMKPKGEAKSSSAKKPPVKKLPGRRYLTPTGFEVVVGKNDKENDWITFRLAGSQDIWMHAADYPGSHVIIRNPNRREIPLKTIQEAAEIAAFNSQAKEQPKVAVHYTLKKFVTKPPRAKPGLVRLSSFKTILVEPRNDLKKIDS